MKMMYLSNGSMEYFDGSVTRAVSSQRLEQYIRTLRELEKQHAWKTEGEGAKFMNQRNPYANAAEYQSGRVTGFVPYRDGILYAVDLGQTGGIHTKDYMNPEEPEGLVTSAVGFHAEDMVLQDDVLYLSVREGYENHIARMDPATGHYDTLTEGDTKEGHPFLGRDERTLYFDMRGFARDENRRVMGVGPSAIAAMNLTSGEISDVFADESLNCLKYTEATDGTRRMMVRPYKAQTRNANPLGCLLAPFSAIQGFIHVFSSINAARKGKEPPLKTANAEAARQMDAPLVVDGVAIDMKALEKEQKSSNEAYPGLIPRDWKLVAIQPDGSLQTLQQGVMDYIPTDDGGYIYSNGKHVIQVSRSGERKLLFKAHLATNLRLLP